MIYYGEDIVTTFTLIIIYNQSNKIIRKTKTCTNLNKQQQQKKKKKNTNSHDTTKFQKKIQN